jgi:hypothetical protein
MRIGDRVATQRIGVPVIGTVVGAVSGEDFEAQHTDLEYWLWDRHYSDWRDDNVLYLRFESPIKPYSFQEFCDLNHGMKNIKTLITLYKRLAYYENLAYPAQDCILESEITILNIKKYDERDCCGR